jgi:hypothetical protein
MPSNSYLLTHGARAMVCGALILFVTPLRAGAQNSEPEKAPTENVRPLFQFSAGEPSGLRVEQWGSGMGTNPGFLKGANLSAAPQQPIHFRGEQQTPTTLPTLNLPPMPNFAKFATTSPAATLEISDPFNFQKSQRLAAVIPKTPDALRPRNPPQLRVCSVPLLQVHPDPGVRYTIKQIQAPGPAADRAMSVEPWAPSVKNWAPPCDEN